MTNRPLRFFLGPTEVAGYYAQLEIGLREVGCRVTRIDLDANARRFAEPSMPFFARLARRLGRITMDPSRSRPVRRAASMGQSAALVATAIMAALTCDVIVYAFGSTICWHPRFELALMRRLRRRTIAVFHGSDSRPPYLDGQSLAVERQIDVEACARLTLERKARVRFFEERVDLCIDNPLSAHFRERPFVNWQVIGIPFAGVAEVAARDEVPAVLRVLHSPSHPETKGTPLIRDAVERLRSRGARIDYVEVIGQPNAVVMEELRRCDLVIDQAYSDTPMAGFATEAAALGRPTLVGGLGAPDFDGAIPADLFPPVIACHPDELADRLEQLVAEPQRWRSLGAEANAYVRTHRRADAVASRFVRLALGDVPVAWMSDPQSIRYCGGCGNPNRIRGAIRELVSRYGPAALMLDDKPTLRDLIIAFADARSTAPATPDPERDALLPVSAATA